MLGRVGSGHTRVSHEHALGGYHRVMVTIEADHGGEAMSSIVVMEGEIVLPETASEGGGHAH